MRQTETWERAFGLRHTSKRRPSALLERRGPGRDRVRDLRLALHGREQQLGDVDDLDLLARLAVGLPGGEAVVQHHLAERAAGGDLRRRGAERLVHALDVD